MSRFQFPKSIISRPLYGVLKPRQGKFHLMIADAEGAEALFDVALADPEIMAKSHIMYFPKNTGQSYIGKLEELGAAQLYIGPSYEASVSRLRKILNDAKVGLQIYLTGTESLIGQGMQEVAAAGIPHTEVQTEHRGSVARRMQCVHCKGITEDVIYDPFVCSHCGLNLFVRDHYSRRHAAFQGVCVDAENPGDIPDPVELYS
ncbi:dimethylamine monooxygenase subunit DmmA family protein [Kiloniella sp. EL199]|uniref:dimethylamine monooxygenase subunit DmmA family protein n=1 Tax=Kiloniella sp. EL199 TaxID=2107581 RepID=UPI000EA18CC3|nr:dimethylamine monooxygenase subunit DmmA family protein [Kiloniella sp. EL199]